MPGAATRLRTLGYSLLLVALLVGPILIGFRIAQAGNLTALDPDEIVASPPGESGVEDPADSPQVLSERPLGDAASSIEDALTPGTGDGTAFARLTLISSEEERFHLENGVPITLTGDLALTVTLDPFPPTRFDVNVGMALTRAGAPVTDATFETSWDMTFMYHGPFETTLVQAESGRYAADYDFFMFGPWGLDTVVSVPGIDPIEFAIEIYVWPSD